MFASRPHRRLPGAFSSECFESNSNSSCSTQLSRRSPADFDDWGASNPLANLSLPSQHLLGHQEGTVNQIVGLPLSQAQKDNFSALIELIDRNINQDKKSAKLTEKYMMELSSVHDEDSETSTQFVPLLTREFPSFIKESLHEETKSLCDFSSARVYHPLNLILLHIQNRLILWHYADYSDFVEVIREKRVFIESPSIGDSSSHRRHPCEAAIDEHIKRHTIKELDQPIQCVGIGPKPPSIVHSSFPSSHFLVVVCLLTKTKVMRLDPKDLSLHETEFDFLCARPKIEVLPSGRILGLNRWTNRLEELLVSYEKPTVRFSFLENVRATLEIPLKPKPKKQQVQVRQSFFKRLVAP